MGNARHKAFDPLVGGKVRAAVDGDELLASRQLAQHVDGDVVGRPGTIHEAVLSPGNRGSCRAAVVQRHNPQPFLTRSLEQGGIQMLGFQHGCQLGGHVSPAR